MNTSLSDLLVFPWADLEPDKQAEPFCNLIDAILCRLDCWYHPSTQEYPPQVSSDDLRLLDRAVKELTNLLRTRAPIGLWSRYQAVDKSFPKLRLCRRIKALLHRANVNVPDRPFVWFDRIRFQKGPLADLAGRLIKVYSQLADGSFDRDTVQWEEFAPLLLAYRNRRYVDQNLAAARGLLQTRVKSAIGGLNLLAYAVYLEIEFEEQGWILEFGEGIWKLIEWTGVELQDAELFQELDRFLLGGDPALDPRAVFEENRRKAQRIRVAARQRRHRHRESAKKSSEKA